MLSSSFITRIAALSAFVALAACGPSGGGSSSAPATGPTTVPASTLSFTTIGSAPTTLSGTNQSVPLPTIAGVAAVGGTDSDAISVTAPTAVNAVVSMASVGGSGGPPTLQSFGRSTMSIGGVAVTPLYYVGVTNTGGTATTVTFNNLKLGLGTLPAGTSVGLAHYDPSQPQNGWNQHCAFGPGQVSVNGNQGTFTPGGTGATLTIYPGSTLWFAPYAYPTAITAVPTSPPAATPTTPTVTAPTSLTGTYIGSAAQTSPSAQAPQYLEVSLTQTGSTVTGTIAALPSGPNDSGFFATASGSISGGTVTLTATPTAGGSCPATITFPASAPIIAGTFSSPACSSGGNNNSANSGTFSATLQTAGTLPTVSGTYTGTINDTQNGAGTISLVITPPGGTVFSGTANVSFPANPTNGGTGTFVGFVVNATTAEFAVIGNNNSNNNNNNNNNGGSCNPFGTLTISGNTLTGTYTNSGGGNGTNGNSCPATGTITVSH